MPWWAWALIGLAALYLFAGAFIALVWSVWFKETPTLGEFLKFVLLWGRMLL